MGEESKKQNILIVHNYYQIPGGEDTVVANEKKMLEKHGHKVTLYSRNNAELKKMPRLRKIFLPITTVFNPRTYRDIKKLIKQENIEVVHVHNTLNLVSPAVYYAARRMKVPVVQTIHNFRLLCPGATFYRDGHICEDCVEHEIQVITKSKEDKCVKAEIESNSTVAFIEKNVKRDWQGTTIILKVKEKYRFSELKNYINTYFRYPSVEIQLVNVDILDSYIDKDIIFNDKIIQIIEKANHQRNEILSDFLPDRQCLNKLRKILLKNENKKEVLSKIYDVLDNVFHKSYVKENLLDYIRKTEQMNDCINLVRKEVDREIEESEEKIEKYPGFLTVLCQLDLEKTVGYNQLIFEMDNTFDIKEVYKEKKKDSSDRGILFVFTDFADYDLGIEWHSVNAFLFQKNKIVSNFVKFETDLSEESDRNIFSLEEITNADYEISEKLHEPEMEEYYEEYFGGDNEEFYDNPYFCCDVILLNNNNFYFLTSVYEFEIDKITKSNDIIKDYSLGNTIVFPDEYKDECGLFKDSKLYQDGILLDILPQCIVPIGVTYVSVNLTGKSRFELNVSRHELNKNREVIKKWGQKAGKIIQRKVVQNCKQVFEENGLEYDQEDLLVAKGNDDFAKECYENMKNILSEVEG